MVVVAPPPPHLPAMQTGNKHGDFNHFLNLEATQKTKLEAKTLVKDTKIVTPRREGNIQMRFRVLASDTPFSAISSPSLG